METATEIKITANIDASRPNACRFSIDRTIADGSYYFQSAEQAKGSPLAERLFGWDEIASVMIAGKDVTVTRTNADEWRAAAKKIAEMIRDHIRSGEPAISEKLKAAVLPAVELKNKVQEIFDRMINPAVAGHGGFVELVDVKDNKIYLRMGGGCHGCASSTATLRNGIENMIRQQIPQIGEIIDVTDHATGANPYYR